MKYLAAGNSEQCKVKMTSDKIFFTDGSVFYFPPADRTEILQGYMVDQVLTVGSIYPLPLEILHSMKASRIPKEFRRIHLDLESGNSRFIHSDYEPMQNIWWERKPEIPMSKKDYWWMYTG